MLDMFDNAAKKRLAIGRNRDPALRVIMPRAIGAFVTEGRVVRDDDGKRILEVLKGPFWMRLEPDTRHVNFFIHHRMHGDVMSGRLYSDGNGNDLDGRLRLLGWDRRARNGAILWQLELFETFAEDSDWLLNIPKKMVRPEIV